MLADKYYYHRLPIKNQILYEKVYSAILEFKPSLRCRDQEFIQKDIETIDNAIILDNPHLFYYGGVYLLQTDVNGNTELFFYYYFNKDEYVLFQQQVTQQAYMLLERVIARTNKQEELVRIVHNYLVSNIAYDKECLIKNDSEETGKYAHSILGVFIKQKAVCDGFAKAFKYLLNAINIGCIIVTGNIRDETTDRIEAHAWNLVKIDGDNYYIDVTFDTDGSEEGFISYDYYNLSEELIRKDHFGFDGYPACISEKYNYFNMNSALVYNTVQLLEYVEQRISGLPAYIYVRLSYECSFADVLELVREKVMECMFQQGISGTVRFKLREKQKVIHIIVTE